MKIGLLLDDTLDTPDGVQQYVLTLGRWLEKSGHEVHYLVGDSKRQDIDNLHPLAKVIRLKFNGNRVGTPLPASKKRIIQVLGELKLDVLHVQMPYSPVFAARVINLAPEGTKIVGSFHVLPNGLVADIGARLLKFGLLSSLKKVDCFISNTANTQDFFKSAWGVESVIVPNPVHINQFITKEKYAWSKSRTQIVFLGRIVERKGALNLVEAMKFLPKSLLTKIDLHIGGRGPLYEELEKRIKGYGLSETVKLHGFITEEDKPRFLASADICIFPSTGGESFGVSLLEPMASGNSVILAGHNMGYDSVMGERADLMFDANNPKAIANRLAYWLRADKSEIKSTKKWLKEHCFNYDIEKSVGPKILDIYSQ